MVFFVYFTKNSKVSQRFTKVKTIINVELINYKLQATFLTTKDTKFHQKEQRKEIGINRLIGYFEILLIGVNLWQKIVPFLTL